MRLGFFFLYVIKGISSAYLLTNTKGAKIMELEKEYSCLTKNRLAFNKTINVDKNYQQTLEGYLDDLFRVVRCDSHSFVTSCDINDGSVIVDGKTEICLTYCNENGELLYTEFVEDFSEKVNVDGIDDSSFAIADFCDKYTNFRVINQRRIDVHTSFGLCVKVYSKQSCPCLKKCDNSRLNSYKAKEQSIENYLIKKLEYDEEFLLPDGANGINRVISCNVNSSLIESKTIKDKVFIKIKSDVTCLYTNESNKIEKAQYSFEVSKICDISGVEENTKSYVKIKNGCIFAKAKSSIDSSSGKIEIYGDLYVGVTVINEFDIELCVDGYVIGRKVNNTYSSYVCNNVLNEISLQRNEQYSLKVNNDIKSVLDLFVCIDDCTLKNGKCVVTLTTNIMFVNKLDETECYKETKELEFAVDYDQCLCVFAKLKSYDFNISSDNSLNININYEISGTACESREVKVLTDIECTDVALNSSALTVYFAKADEMLWDIAKMFSSDIDLIKKENELTADVIDSNKVIIIPGV